MSLLRPLRFTRHYVKYPEGSCLIQMGHTKVLCTASLTNNVPDYAEEQNKGWISAEYSMLPRAGQERTPRGKIASGGRTREIQRLIGRALRSAVDLQKIPGVGVILDCDVLQADGGTRTAAINGAFVAMVDALRQWQHQGRIPQWPIADTVAAVSVGICEGQVVLDLNYEKDAAAEVDMNVVMTGSGKFVEVQGTAEHRPFSRRDLDHMLTVAEKGIQEILRVQRSLLGDVRK